MKKNISLKNLIRLIGRTYAQFGQMIGVSEKIVKGWVRGRPALTTEDAELISRVTGVNPKDLVPGTGGVLTVGEDLRRYLSYSWTGAQRKDWTFIAQDYCPSTTEDDISEDYRTERLAWLTKELCMRARYAKTPWTRGDSMQWATSLKSH